MSIIDCMKSIGNQYFFGIWYKDLHSKEGKQFQYELLDEPRNSYGMVVNNLIKTQGRKTIKTNWEFNWQPKQIIVDNEGDRWKIQQVVEIPQEVNPQVAHFAINPDKAYALSLVKIANPMEIGI